MRPIRKPKVGLVGVMCTPFRGDKEAGYGSSRAALEALAEAHAFEFHPIQEGLYDLEQARRAADELGAWGADLVLVQTSSFGPGELIYPLAALPALLGLWAVPEGPPTEEGGLPLNSFTAANMYNSILGRAILGGEHRPVKWFYGRTDDPLFAERLGITVQALRALVNLRGARVGLVGGVAPGFDNLIVDGRQLLARLGVHLVRLELEALLSRARAYDAGQTEAARQAIQAGAAQLDPEQEPALEKAGRVYQAYRDLVEEADLDALAVSCWPRFQAEYHFAVCSVMGMANEEGLIAACEGDVASAVSMLTLKYLSGGQVVTLMDLAAVDEADETILLWHCGPTAPSLADEGGVRMGSLWLFDGYEGDPIGLHNDLVLKPGQATVAGFTPDFGHMLVLEGAFDNRKPGYVGSRAWMGDLRLNGQPLQVRDLVQTLMASHFQHHYPVLYGPWTPAAIELCAWLGIAPIQAVPYTAYLQAL